MKYTPEQIGSVVRHVRKTLGLTRDAVALTAGTGLRFITDLEHGKPTCEIGKVLAVMNTLGIDITISLPGDTMSATKKAE